MYACHRLTIRRMVHNELASGTKRFSRRQLLGVVLVTSNVGDELSPLSALPKLTLVEFSPYDLLGDLLW